MKNVIFKQLGELNPRYVVHGKVTYPAGSEAQWICSADDLQPI